MSKAGPRILIVDDREQNRYVLCRVLRQAGYVCMEATAGTEALELAKSLPEMIILDVSLPDISGYEVAAESSRTPEPPRSRSCRFPHPSFPARTKPERWRPGPMAI